MSITTIAGVSGGGPTWSASHIQTLIDDINSAISAGHIASAGGTVTTALADLASQRDLV